MQRRVFVIFEKKKIWASKFFYRTSDFRFHLSCGQVEMFLICQPLIEGHVFVYKLCIRNNLKTAEGKLIPAQKC